MIETVADRQLGERLFVRLGHRRYPMAGQWELTCRCNLRCVMCYTDCFNTPERLRHELTLTEITRIMDELHAEGCLELCLTGGEPLARRDFREIYDYAKDRGFLLTIFTNGTLVTPAIADHWRASPPTMVEISMHGLGPESFERITQGPGSHARCLAGIRRLLERKLPLTLKTTGMTLNRDEIVRIRTWVAELGDEYGTTVRYKFGSDVRPRLDSATDVQRFQLAAGDVDAIERADPELSAERDRQNHAYLDHTRRGASLCGAEQSRFHIDAYGQLQLCSSNRRHSYDLRRGSFAEGFYHYLPKFPCPGRGVAYE